MCRILVILFAILFINGCVAVVDHQGKVSSVKSFIITDDETLDLLEKADQKSPEDKKEITFFKKK